MVTVGRHLWCAIALICWTAYAGSASLSVDSRDGDLEAVEAHIRRGADINAQEISSTPLTAAAGAGRVAVVDLLLKHNADVDLRNSVGWTPLIAAAYNCIQLESTGVAGVLVDHGADITARAEHGLTSLHVAVSHTCHPEFIDLLISVGVPVDIRETSHNMTPLHIAASRAGIENMVQLIKHGADIEARDNYGRTALYFAAQSVNPDIVKYLISRGADVNARANDGLTPLHLVGVTPLGANMEAAADLIRHDAKLDAEDNQVRTPRQYVFCDANSELSETEARMAA